MSISFACARWIRWFILLCVFGFGGNLHGQEFVPTDAAAIRDDAKLLTGLRRRQLHELAVSYCDDLLEKKEISPQRRTRLAVEQIKTLTAMAAFESKQGRDQVWSKIEKFASRFKASFKGNRAMLVDAQAALAQVAQVRLLRQELDVKLAGENATDEALKQIRAARRQLEALIKDIDRAIPSTPQQETATELTSAQLLGLKSNLKFQFAICNLERAGLYAAGDVANRTDALSQANQQIDEVLGTVQPGSDLWWEAVLAASRHDRLAGQPEDAAKQLSRLPLASAPDTLFADTNIERLKVLQAVNNVNAVQLRISELAKLPGREPALDLALLQAAVWLSDPSMSEKNSSVDSRQWKTFATSLLRSIKSSHGGYWGRRAEIELLGALDREAIETTSGNDAATDSDLTILIQIAESAQNEKRFEDAAASYARAVQAAKQLGQSAIVFRLSVRQSRCFENLNQHGSAADALFVAAKSIESDDAAAAHLRGCWNLARESEQAATARKNEVTARFVVQLQQHIEDWPNNPTTKTAKFWLADQYRRQRKFEQAFDTLLSVSPNSAEFQNAAALASQNAALLLSSMKRSGQSTNAMADRLLARLKNVADGSPTNESIYALIAADLKLRFQGQLPTAEQVQQAARFVASAHSESPEIVVAGTAILVVSLMDQSDKFQERVTAVDDATVLRRLNEYLSSIQVSGARRANLAVAERGIGLAKQGNDSSLATFWKLKMADILLKLNQNEAAIETLEALVEQFPRKADLQIKLAQAMTQVYQKSKPETAINQWRRLAGRLRPQSENWFLAKYEVARLLTDSGQKPAALKMLKFMKASPPGWEKSNRKADFDKLFRRLSR